MCENMMTTTQAIKTLKELLQNIDMKPDLIFLFRKILSDLRFRKADSYIELEVAYCRLIEDLSSRRSVDVKKLDNRFRKIKQRFLNSIETDSSEKKVVIQISEELKNQLTQLDEKHDKSDFTEVLKYLLDFHAENSKIKNNNVTLQKNQASAKKAASDGVAEIKKFKSPSSKTSSVHSSIFTVKNNDELNELSRKLAQKGIINKK